MADDVMINIYQATACSRRPPRHRTLALALLQAERWGEA